MGAELCWGAQFSPHPGPGNEEAPGESRLGVPGSEFCSTVGTGWALLTPGGTKPAATWPCPGPRGSG